MSKGVGRHPVTLGLRGLVVLCLKPDKDPPMSKGYRVNMLHYHGTPFTPKETWHRLGGKHFCVSFGDPRDADRAMQYGQSVMWDNGAFIYFTQGRDPDWNKYYAFLDGKLGHPHWAVVPDVIDGTPAENYALAKEWPHRKDLACVVWHMAEPLGQIDRLMDMGFGKLAFGSSGQYWQVGSDIWARRCDEAWNHLAKNGLPWVHMMRGLSLCGDIWPFASADSATVARNYKDADTCPERMMRNIDQVQCPISWALRPEQKGMFDAL